MIVVVEIFYCTRRHVVALSDFNAYCGQLVIHYIKIRYEPAASDMEAYKKAHEEYVSSGKEKAYEDEVGITELKESGKWNKNNNRRSSSRRKKEATA